MNKRPARNLWMALSLTSLMLAMLGASFAAIPLYRVFCAATGYGGTPQIGPEVSSGISTAGITVRFNADVDSGLPWKFAPEQDKMTLKLGEQQVAFYTASNGTRRRRSPASRSTMSPPTRWANTSTKPPASASTSRPWRPARRCTVPGPASWVDPAIAADPSTADVHVIHPVPTRSTSHPVADAAKTGALANAGPHVGSYTRPGRHSMSRSRRKTRGFARLGPLRGPSPQRASPPSPHPLSKPCGWSPEAPPLVGGPGAEAPWPLPLDFTLERTRDFAMMRLPCRERSPRL